MSIAIPFFQQFTGINVIMFYAPQLFRTIGFGDNTSLLSALITGGINVLATIVSIYGTDKWGRRFLFLEGGIQMFIFQVTNIYIKSEFAYLPNNYWRECLPTFPQIKDDDLPLFKKDDDRPCLILNGRPTKHGHLSQPSVSHLLSVMGLQRDSSLSHVFTIDRCSPQI